MMRLGLRTKFFLYSNTLIFVTMGLLTVLGVVHERQSRYEVVVARGRSITEAVAVPITDALMYEELGLVTETGLIDNYITGLLERNQDLLRYVVVTDAAGTVTHSNRWELLGKPFGRALGDSAVGKGSETEMRTSSWGERILEIRTPLHISTRFWGGLAMGFTLENVDREVAAIAKKMALLAVLLMLGNSILTALYVETLIRPILSLHASMRRASGGNYRVRALIRRRDEVGELANAFNGMMEELETARERERLQQSQLAHTEKMAALGTLAAGVAHEVNNPLAGILTCIETMRSNLRDEALCDRYLDLVEGGIKRIEHTVQNLLDFSRPRELRPEPTAINHSLQHVVELADYQLRKNKVEVEFQLDSRDPVVLADHFQMEQLFLNLVLNAIQAMPGGGQLLLRTREVGSRVIVEVRDTGIGIPEEIRDRIFDPFFSTRGVGEGTGLGLAVSYGIVTAHGGKIQVDSRVGVGSTFRVILPAGRQPAPPGEGNA